MNLRRFLPVFLIIVLPSFALAAGNDCVLTQLDFLELENAGRSVEVSLGTAYIGAAAAGDTACLTMVDLGPSLSVLGSYDVFNCEDVHDLAVYVGGQDTTQVAMIGKFLGATQVGQIGYYNLVVRIDVSNPSNPDSLSADFVLGGDLSAVAFDEKGEVYVGSAPYSTDGRFTAVDRDTSIVVQGKVTDILIDGTLAYVIASDIPDRLHIIDTESLTILSTLNVGSSPQELDLRHDGVLFIADNGAGIIAVDVNDPHAPSILGTPGGSRLGIDVAVVGDRAYVADTQYNSRLNVYDVSDPTNIVCLSTLGGVGSGRGVVAMGTTAWLLDQPGLGNGPPGLIALDALDCAPATGAGDTPVPRGALRVAPNVLRSGPARITLRTESARRPVPLRVVDVNGRTLTHIPLYPEGDGVWTARWEPVNAAGRPVAAGKYWVVGNNVAEAVTVIK